MRTLNLARRHAGKPGTVERAAKVLVARGKPIHPKKPTRRDLLAVVCRLQGHIGDAMQWLDSDTTQDAKARMRAALSTAHDLCVSTREHDPP